MAFTFTWYFLGYAPFYYNGKNVFNIPVIELEEPLVFPSSSLEAQPYYFSDLSSLDIYVTGDTIRSFNLSENSLPTPSNSIVTPLLTDGTQLGISGYYSPQFVSFVNGEAKRCNRYVGGEQEYWMIWRLAGHGGKFFPMFVRFNEDDSHWESFVLQDDEAHIEYFPDNLYIVQNSRPEYVPDPDVPDPDVPDPDVPDPDVPDPDVPDPDVPENPSLPDLNSADIERFYLLGQAVKMAILAIQREGS